MKAALWCAVWGVLWVAYSILLIASGVVWPGAVLLFVSTFGFMPVAVELLGI